MTQPYLASKITLPTNPNGSFTFPQDPEWRNSPPPYAGMKPPPPLFSTSRSGLSAEPIFKANGKPFHANFGESKGFPRWLIIALLGLAWLIVFS